MELEDKIKKSIVKCGPFPTYTNILRKLEDIYGKQVGIFFDSTITEMVASGDISKERVTLGVDHYYL